MIFIGNSILYILKGLCTALRDVGDADGQIVDIQVFQHCASELFRFAQAMQPQFIKEKECVDKA